MTNISQTIQSAGTALTVAMLKETFAFVYSSGTGQTALLESQSRSQLEKLAAELGADYGGDVHARRIAGAGAAIISTGLYLTEIKNALLAGADAKKTALRQSSEAALVAFQADYETAESLLLEVLFEKISGGNRVARTAALYKNAEFLLQGLMSLLTVLALEEPVVLGAERVLGYSSNLARMSAVVRDLCGSGGPGSTADIMAALGINS